MSSFSLAAVCALLAVAVVGIAAIAYICASPLRSLMAWVAMLGAQAEFGDFHLGVSDALAVPLAVWGVLLAIKNPPAMTKLRVALLTFAGLFLTWGHLTAALYLGHLPKWTYVNKDVGLVEMLLCILAISCIVDSKQKLEQLAVAFVTGGSALNVAALLLGASSVFTGFGKFVIYGDLRFTGFMPNPNAWAFYLATVAMFQLFLLIFHRAELLRIPRIAQWVNLALLAAGIFVSMSRSGILALFVGLFSSLFLMGWERKRAILRFSLVAAILLSIPLSQSGILGLALNRILEPDTVNDRVVINRAAWAMYTESPVTTITGVGIGSFIDTTQARIGSDQQIHNSYLWLLVEGGPILLGLFLAMVFLAFSDSVRTAKSPLIDLFGIAVFSSLIAWVVFSAANEGMYQRQFWLLLALPDVLTRISGQIRVIKLSSFNVRKAFLAPDMGV
jgi:hypothetical protein